MKIKRIHHLTIAVRDAHAAGATFARLFGAEAPGGATEVQAFGVRSAEVALGDGTLQVVSPLGTDSAVMRFLERKGEGFYNLALEVEDLDAAVAELAAQGVRVSEPVEAEPGVRSAFVTMAATHGLSVQLVQLTAAAQPELRAPEPEVPAPTPEPRVEAPAAVGPASDAPEVWSDREEAAARPPLDLTPDEWSDVD